MINMLPSCLLFRAYLRRAFSFICASSVLRMLSLASCTRRCLSRSRSSSLLTRSRTTRAASCAQCDGERWRQNVLWPAMCTQTCRRRSLPLPELTLSSTNTRTHPQLQLLQSPITRSC